MAADLKKIYQSIRPGPSVRGPERPLCPPRRRSWQFRLGDEAKQDHPPSDKPTFQLLAGHIGSGKSTELRRVQKELETGDDRFFTVFCQVLEDIDPTTRISPMCSWPSCVKLPSSFENASESS